MNGRTNSTRSESCTEETPIGKETAYLRYLTVYLRLYYQSIFVIYRIFVYMSTFRAGSDGYLISKDMDVEPDWRSNYRGDYQNTTVRPIRTADLICWSFQIARGMDYLATRKVHNPCKCFLAYSYFN